MLEIQPAGAEGISCSTRRGGINVFAGFSTFALVLLKTGLPGPTGGNAEGSTLVRFQCVSRAWYKTERMSKLIGDRKNILWFNRSSSIETSSLSSGQRGFASWWLQTWNSGLGNNSELRNYRTGRSRKISLWNKLGGLGC